MTHTQKKLHHFTVIIFKLYQNIFLKFSNIQKVSYFLLSKSRLSVISSFYISHHLQTWSKDFSHIFKKIQNELGSSQSFFFQIVLKYFSLIFQHSKRISTESFHHFTVIICKVKKNIGKAE